MKQDTPLVGICLGLECVTKPVSGKDLRFSPVDERVSVRMKKIYADRKGKTVGAWYGV